MSSTKGCTNCNLLLRRKVLPSNQLRWQVILSPLLWRVVVAVLVPFMVAKVFHQIRYRVAEVERHGFVHRRLHVFLRPLTQPCPNRVPVDVVYLLLELPRGVNVEAVEGWLPNVVYLVTHPLAQVSPALGSSGPLTRADPRRGQGTSPAYLIINNASCRMTLKCVDNFANRQRRMHLGIPPHNYM